MPPERFPWDRKDLRKYVRPTPRWRESSSSHYGSKYDKSTPRWRESSSNHYGSSRDFSRWGGSNEFRRPPGHGKQGGWHMFAEESGHGYTPFRSCDRMLDDKNFRPTVARVDGKYGRNSRDRASFGARDWRAHSWDMSNGSPNTPGRLHDLNNDQRSVDDILTYPTSHAQPEFSSSWNQVHPKEQHDNNKLNGVNWLEEGQRCDREASLDWKPLKWARSISLSSRGSGFSNSSCSKSLGGTDSNEGKADLHVKNVPVVTSPSGEAAACVTSALFEEMSAKKKLRLNWGEGLAKYEKKRVEGPEERVDKDGAGIYCGDHEAIHSERLKLVDNSPRVVGLSECGSPATPSSVACSSQGPEEKSFGKAINVDNNAINLCGSPSTGSQSPTECFPLNLEVLDGTSITNLLVELLQYDDSSVDSSFVRSTVMNKLLILKDNLSKTLEVTEFEIDSLENELKSLKCDSGSRCPRPAVSGSLLVEDNAKLCSEQVVASNNIPRPSPLQVFSCADENVEEVPVCNNVLDEANCGIKDDDVDSPGTATSKFFEPVSTAKAVCSPHGPVKLDEYSGDTNVEGSAVSSPGDVNMLVESKGASASSILTHAEDNLCNMILVANKESASRASNIFCRLLPRDQCKVDFSEISNIAWQKDDAMVREKFSLRRRLMKFRERVVAIKFKAFHHLWKEDMRLLSIRKYRAKSQKKNESTLRTTQCVIQKNRSSLRLRFSSPVGNLSLVPTTEMLNFTSKLLSEPEVKLYRNDLKMPSLVLDKKERNNSHFISRNGLVEDPWAVEKERAMINPWTPEERETFIDKLATFGKDFQKIASFLAHKTTADCVEFYYKNHKSNCFERAKKSKQGKPSTNYLVASGNNWKREMNAASLDGTQKQQVHDDDGKSDKPSNFDMLEDERETVAADILAGISGTISSESQKVNNNSVTSDVSQNADDETCSDDSCGEMTVDGADWTDEEKCVFVQAVSCYGKDFDMISECVGTRSRDQCKVFFSKARKCLGLDSVHPGLGNTEEDGCALETTCPDKSGLLRASVTEKTSDSCLTENKVNSPFDHGSKVDQSEFVQAQENSNESVSSEARREKTSEDGNSAGQAINLESSTVQVVKEGEGVCFEGKKFLFRESSLKSQIDVTEAMPCVFPCLENGKKSAGVEGDHILRGYPLQIPEKEECLVPEIPLSQQSKKQVPSSGDVKLFGKILSKPNPNPNPVDSVMKFDQMALENVPVKRSYGLWDGNKIHTSVPDYFLFKYPEAFRSSSPSSTSVPTGGSNGLVDYQMYKPFSGFEPVVGVSDPVAALKMHYSKASGQNGEQEAWSSRGHFGR